MNNHAVAANALLERFGAGVRIGDALCTSALPLPNSMITADKTNRERECLSSVVARASECLPLECVYDPQPFSNTPDYHVAAISQSSN